MANNQANKKLHGLSKNERLCNFSLKTLLFQQGNTFQQYPFKVFWKSIDKNMETLFFQKSVTDYVGNAEQLPALLHEQNPSFPYRKVPDNGLFFYPAKCLFGVSSKVHKSAVIRNNLKRLTKESYRQNKVPFYSFLEGINTYCLLAVIYTAKPILSYAEIEEKIIVSLQKIQQKIIEKQNNKFN